MTDFVSGLREQLVAAAARERPRERRALALRPLVPVLAAAAVVAAVVAGIALLSARPATEDENRSVAPRTGDAQPLFGGTLEAGVRYGTVALVPAVTFEVGDGRWMARETESDTYVLLQRQAPSPEGFGQRQPPIGAIDIGRYPLVYDPAVRDDAKSVVSAPPDFAAWLRAHPDVEAGEPRPTSVGELDGVVMDVTYRFRRPAHAAPECRFREMRCTALAPGDVHANGSRWRVWVLESDPGPLVIQVGAYAPGDHGEMLAAAQPVLDSLELTRR